MASTLNIKMDQGSSFYRLLKFVDSSDVPIDLTGYTFRGQGRTAYGVASASFSFTFTLKNQGTYPGEVEMELDDSDTASLSLTRCTEYVYDVERVAPDATVTRIFQGKFTIYPEATK